ncbi:methyltransferase domain-containing protein [Wolbachia endosymbiont of Litomosoides brasiliensis]|uniref:methyltransferase n=1 Tax=Wolbachia endosymbiont of Litomosoides brasiliensis TaxID=1812117 RepID=UPI00158B06A0|nr:methyltransferase domain-containing protein [Wolbachia endosymbiont of Litomosoides brasiliensis]NUY39534.1 methyltransferase domain-containing protein [Wolbachia endosymbiont of Litomosoides brasiliensis]
MKSNLSFVSIILNFICKLISMFNIKKAKQFAANKYRALHKEITVFLKKSKNLLSTNIEIGLYHFYKGNISDAKLRFWLTGMFYSNLPIVWYNIGRCHFAMGNTSKAYTYLTKTLRLDNNYEEASYYIKKMINPAPIIKLPKNIIKQYFDYTGEHFVEHWLIAKQYRGHELVHTVITKIFNDSTSELNILDLGCGTGICGHFLKIHNTGNHITGIDISNRMLNIARGCFIKGKPVYNELIHIEMTEFLKQGRNHLYDVIIFAEVLHYLHDFKVELELAKKSTSKKGAIVCLIRRKEGKGIDFVNKGDYFRHSESYVQHVVKEINMQISYMSYCKIYGSQVDGILFALQHPQKKSKSLT